MQDRCAFLEEEIPRIESGLAHTEEQLGIYVSAAETERLTTLAKELRGQLAGADIGVGRIDGAVGRHMSWSAGGLSGPDLDYSQS